MVGRAGGPVDVSMPRVRHALILKVIPNLRFKSLLAVHSLLDWNFSLGEENSGSSVNQISRPTSQRRGGSFGSQTSVHFTTDIPCRIRPYLAFF